MGGVSFFFSHRCMRGRREVSRLSNGAFSGSSRRWLGQSSLQDCCVPSWTTCPAFGTFPPTLLLTFFLSHTFLSPQAPFKDLCFPFPLSSPFPAIPTECFASSSRGLRDCDVTFSFLIISSWVASNAPSWRWVLSVPAPSDPFTWAPGQDPTVLLLLGVPQGFRPWPHSDACKGWLWTEVAGTVRCWQQFTSSVKI